MRLLLPQDLRARGIPYSSWQLRRLEAAGKFPRRVLLIPGGQRVAWREHEINDWIESREPRAKVAKPREASRRECARPDCDAEFEVPQRERGGRPPKYCPEHTTSKAAAAAAPARRSWKLARAER